MLLVEDQQPEAEARAYPRHVDVGAVVRRDRDGLEIHQSVADDAGVVAQRRQDAAVPLVHQIANGRDHERGDLRPRHDRKGHLRLARSRGHDDLAATAGLFPGGRRLRLVRTQLRQRHLRPKHRLRFHFITASRKRAPHRRLSAREKLA